jgi:hypothetical protein
MRYLRHGYFRSPGSQPCLALHQTYSRNGIGRSAPSTFAGEMDTLPLDANLDQEEVEK